MNQDKYDTHGDIDITSEKSSINIKTNLKKNSTLIYIQGITLNSLLKSLFILYGYQSLSDKDVEGGLYCWESILESILISLRHYCNIQELRKRILYIINMYFKENKLIQCNLFYGAISFLCYWLQSFHMFLSQIDLLQLQQSINQYSNIMISYQSYSEQFKEYSRCFARLEELQDIIKAVVKIYITPTTSLSHNSIFNHNDLSNNNKNVYNNTSNYRNKIKDTSNLDPKLFHNQPNVIIQKGNWLGYEVDEKKNELKQMFQTTTTNINNNTTTNSNNTFKLEIFGGEQILDEYSTDDNEEENDIYSTYNCNNKPLIQNIIPKPTPRIRKGYNLLQSVQSISTDLFIIDPLEVARQWTIVDHYLFTSIPIYSLISTINPTMLSSMNNSMNKASINHMVPPIYSMSRYEQLRHGVLSNGIHGGVRTLIDRFNAMSNWVTYSILMHFPIDLRVKKISYFITLAVHLESLCNYNGLMAILTALQQGCITRLKHSFEMIPNKDKLVLLRLQKAMSGIKNYQNYRKQILSMNQILQNKLLSNSNNNSYKYNIPIPVSTKNKVSNNNNNNINNLKIKIWKNVIFDRFSLSTLYEQQQMQDQLLTQSSQIEFKNNLTTGNQSSFSVLSEDKIYAVVPHIGAHLAELTSIQEGNGDYLLDIPHLFNVEKALLLAKPMQLLATLQEYHYNLEPIRLIMNALNYYTRLHCRLSSNDANAYAKKLYTRSNAIEPAGMTREAVDQTISTNKQQQKHVNSQEDVSQYQRSNAYDRIKEQHLDNNNNNTNKCNDNNNDNYNNYSNNDYDDDGNNEEEDDDSNNNDHLKSKSYLLSAHTSVLKAIHKFKNHSK